MNCLLRAELAGVLLLLPMLGCDNAPSPEEQERLSTFYSELLLAKNRYENDSAARAALLDSLLTAYDYESLEAAEQELKSLTLQPEVLRAVFDSARVKLERIQAGDSTSNGDTAPSTQATDKLMSGDSATDTTGS